MTAAPGEHKRVAVFPGSRCDSERRLLASLAELYPVEFLRETDLPVDRMDAAVFYPEAWDQSQRVFERGVTSFRFVRHPHGICLAGEECVSFSDHLVLHAAFRGAQVPLGRKTSVAPQPPSERDHALASHGSTRLWQFRREARLELHTSAFAPSALRHDQLLWSYLRPANWAALLPLLHFLRRVTAGVDWTPAPARGCFMFDDPNLHSVRYGYLDFAHLAREAQRHNYHVAFATVPLDTCYAAPKAVELFRGNRERLSLLIHGNDHARNELGRKYSAEGALGILAQALRRVGDFERRTGLRVARVIAPPHGGCSDSIMSQVPRLPIEGVCTSVGSLVPGHDGRSLPLDFGLSPGWFMAGGCPVLRRWDLAYGLTPLRFSAFLGQPIIPYGHHQDCADGIGRLAQLADTLNSWEAMAWTDLDTIFRRNYRTRKDSGLLHVEMRARRVEVPLPADVTHVMLHLPMGVGDESELTLSSDGGASQIGCAGVPIPVAPSGILKVSILPRRSVDPASVGRPSYRLWPPLRRALAIGRDRLAPGLRGLRG